MSSRPRGVRVTRADLAELPDDGYRYEVVDGELFVSAAPSFRHQVAVGNLYVLLRSACPPDLVVVVAPFAVGLAEDTEIQPDVLVAARSSFTERDLPVAPLLAVEVLSPSSRRADLLVKRERLARAGCPSYWVVDPQRLRLTVWELRDGEPVSSADVGPGESWTASRPFPVTVTPADLVD